MTGVVGVAGPPARALAGARLRDEAHARAAEAACRHRAHRLVLRERQHAAHPRRVVGGRPHAARGRLEASADARAARVDATPPREVSGFVFAAVAAHGLQAVRTAHKAVGGTPNFSLEKLFHEVVAWKTDGFDR